MVHYLRKIAMYVAVAMGGIGCFKPVSQNKLSFTCQRIVSWRLTMAAAMCIDPLLLLFLNVSRRRIASWKYRDLAVTWYYRVSDFWCGQWYFRGFYSWLYCCGLRPGIAIWGRSNSVTTSSTDSGRGMEDECLMWTNRYVLPLYTWSVMNQLKAIED